MDNSTNGDAAAVATVRADTAASSLALSQNIPLARQHTRKTNALTLGQSFEILQQSILECQKAGAQIEIVNDTESGAMVILFGNAHYCESCRNLSAGKACQHCQHS